MVAKISVVTAVLIVKTHTRGNALRTEEFGNAEHGSSVVVNGDRIMIGMTIHL